MGSSPMPGTIFLCHHPLRAKSCRGIFFTTALLIFRSLDDQLHNAAAPLLGNIPIACAGRQNNTTNPRFRVGKKRLPRPASVMNAVRGKSGRKRIRSHIPAERTAGFAILIKFRFANQIIICRGETFTRNNVIHKEEHIASR